MPGKAIIIGATSGIGRSLAVELHNRGYIVGATGRRNQRLKELQDELGDRLYIQTMDVSHTENAIKQLKRITDQMNGLDIIVLNAGISRSGEGTTRKTDLKVVDINIRGFANLTSFCFEQFEKQGHGHLVGISSIASLFGWGRTPVYNASKSFVNTYLQGYRQKANHSDANITITNILPGFVRSEMTENKKNMFWVSSAKKAATQIADAIEAKKDKAYVTKRWRLIAWLIKLIPEKIWNRM
ncbi:SDR family NAD(P)-dependent oxidoreductase [Fodinibius salsisoli]|uniref:SDR family NAD(P)-dependent oxidoreductase n=1 Tax=Fodinibius salsisoli TaxID=2820877 RepID=A0ABT3PP50_9BACT|nr:SDR family NAD(P)-dependent oxidoreductase [Fodinibius salsisoli]MCW9707617.1 SDR family NAD(P)-dependent oxidoreductase [Fodinibius salsisoli]